MEKLTEESVIVEVVINLPLTGSPLPKGGGGSYTSPTTQHFPATLQRHCTEICNKYSQKWNCAASFAIYVSVSYLNIPTIGPPLMLQK